MNSGVAGKSSSGIITLNIELGGRFFLSPLLVQHSQNKRVFLTFLFSQVRGNDKILLSPKNFSFFFFLTLRFTSDLIFPFPPPQSLGEKI